MNLREQEATHSGDRRERISPLPPVDGGDFLLAISVIFSPKGNLVPFVGHASSVTKKSGDLLQLRPPGFILRLCHCDERSEEASQNRPVVIEPQRVN